MEIKVGNYEVYRDGSIVSILNEPIDFILSKEAGFILRILFTEDSNIKDPKIKVSSFGNNGAQMLFINFNNPLGTGNGDPIKIGKINDRELFLNYRVYGLEKGAQLFHYTWLFENNQEVSNAK